MNCFQGCGHPQWVGDGYCDDITNNIACNYDAGDCCLSDIKKEYCIDCLCLEGGNSTTSDTSTTTTITTSTHPCKQILWVGDGYCDDVTNNVECNYDGGDCCLSDIKTNYCDDCLCLEGGNSTNATTGSPEGKF